MAFRNSVLLALLPAFAESFANLNTEEYLLSTDVRWTEEKGETTTTSYNALGYADDILSWVLPALFLSLCLLVFCAFAISRRHYRAVEEANVREFLSHRRSSRLRSIPLEIDFENNHHGFYTAGPFQIGDRYEATFYVPNSSACPSPMPSPPPYEEVVLALPPPPKYEQAINENAQANT